MRRCCCLPDVAGISAAVGIPLVSDVAGFPAFVGVPGFVSFSAVAFIPAVAGVSAVAVPAVFDVASYPADPGVPMLL